MTDRRRRVHFGIDYGTSNSKIVVRDFAAAGGERAHVVLQRNSERLSSSVAVVGDEILFGRRPTGQAKALEGATWYESIKMRAAGDIVGRAERYFRGYVVPCPPGLRAVDLAALTVWWLLGEANQGAEQMVHRRKGEVLAPGMTMGIPMGFFTNLRLRSAFVGIARVAWILFKQGQRLRDGRIRLSEARDLLSEAWGTVQKEPTSDEEVRLWVRSEAEAALWWAFNSPQVASGPYCKVDVGAGTTNSSVFRIVPGKKKMAFFGAASVPTGMDAVDEALAKWTQMETSEMRTLRGREEQLLSGRGASPACHGVFSDIQKALAEAWRQNGSLIRHAPLEQRAWLRDPKLFVLGGGSLVGQVREAVSQRPAGLVGRFPVVTLESLPDVRLNGRLVPRHALPFVLVAYGLSVLAPPIPTVETPNEVPPMPESAPTLRQLSHEDIYAK